MANRSGHRLAPMRRGARRHEEADQERVYRRLAGHRYVREQLLEEQVHRISAVLLRFENEPGQTPPRPGAVSGPARREVHSIW